MAKHANITPTPERRTATIIPFPAWQPPATHAEQITAHEADMRKRLLEIAQMLGIDVTTIRRRASV